MHFGCCLPKPHPLFSRWIWNEYCSGTALCLVRNQSSGKKYEQQYTKIKCFGWHLQFTFTIWKYVSCTALSMQGAKRWCDVSHIALSSEDLGISTRRKWHCCNSLQHRELILASVAEQCMHQYQQFPPETYWTCVYILGSDVLPHLFPNWRK